MPVKPVRTLGRFVFDGIEERLIVGSPGNTGDAFDALGEQFTAAQVPHKESVLAEAGCICGISEQLVVVADLEGAEPEKAVPFSELVEIKEQFFGCTFFVPAAVMIGILLSFLRASEIKMATQPVGNREIGLLDSPKHFLVKLVLKILGRLQSSVGVGVLGLEVCEHLRRFFAAKPIVVVDAAVAMKYVLFRFTPGHRWSEGYIRCGFVGNRW